MCRMAAEPGEKPAEGKPPGETIADDDSAVPPSLPSEKTVADGPPAKRSPDETSTTNTTTTAAPRPPHPSDSGANIAPPTPGRVVPRPGGGVRLRTTALSPRDEVDAGMFDEQTAATEVKDEPSEPEPGDSTQTATRTQAQIGLPIAAPIERPAAAAPPIAARRDVATSTNPFRDHGAVSRITPGSPISATPSSSTPAPRSGARLTSDLPPTEHDDPTIVAPRYPQSRSDHIESTLVHPGLLNARQLPEDMPPVSGLPPIPPAPPPSIPGISSAPPIALPNMTPRDLAVRAALAAASVQEDEQQRLARRERLVDLGTIALLGLAAVVAATASYLSTYWLEATAGTLGKAPAYGSITVVSIIVLVLGGFAAHQKKEELKLACLAMGGVMLLYALIRLIVLPFM
jgi:hypothetical protein